MLLTLATGTWTGVSQLNFVTPNTATTGAKDGNAVPIEPTYPIRLLGCPFPTGLPSGFGLPILIASGADDGLAVDDFSLTPNTSNDPTLSINDVSASEGNAGTTNFTFTVSLSAPAGAGGVTFDIATADGTAISPGDYTSSSLTGQTIPAGSSTYTFTVLVNGDLIRRAQRDVLCQCDERDRGYRDRWTRPGHHRIRRREHLAYPRRSGFRSCHAYTWCHSNH